MVPFDVLLMLLAHHVFPLVTAISMPIEVGQNEPPSLTIPLSSLYHPIPETPEGFKASLRFDRTVPLNNPAAVYANAVEAMDLWSQFGWNSTMTGSKVVWVPGLNSVCISYSAFSLEPQYPLKLKYILLGLYQGILEMTRQSSFYKLSIFLLFQGHNVGYILIWKQSPTLRTLGGDNRINSTLQSITTSSTLNAESGQVIDPNLPSFSIDWNFNAQRVDGADLFTAILDAMVTAAAHDEAEDCPYIYGVSLSGDTVLNIHDTNIFDSPAQKLSYGILLNSMSLITKRVFLAQRRFAEIEFRLQWTGQTFAEGFIMKIGNALGNGTIGTATERR